MLKRKPAKRDDWNILPIPDDVETIDWQQRISAEEYRLLKLGFIPIPACDDYFAFFETNTVYIYWQRSGKYICSFQIVADDEGYHVADVIVSRNIYFGLPIDKEKSITSLNRLLRELLRWIELTERPTKRTDWKNKLMPDKKARLNIERVITDTRYKELQWGFVPRQMEDRLFYFMEDNCLHIHHSWSGYCIFQITFEPDTEGYKIVEVWANRDPDQWKSNDKSDQEWLAGFLYLET